MILMRRIIWYRIPGYAQVRAELAQRLKERMKQAGEEVPEIIEALQKINKLLHSY